MRQLKYFLILGIILFLPNSVHAQDECSVSDTYRLKKIASNITTKYDYSETLPLSGYGSVSFTATINNVIKDIYIMKVDDYYNGTGVIYNGDINNQVLIPGLSPGTSYHFTVYGNIGGNCQGNLIYEFYITMPSYNKFYINPLCKKVPEYKYCQKWVNSSFTEDGFIDSINKYIKSLEVIDTPTDDTTNEENYELFIQIVEFLNKYNLPIFGSTVLISLLGIIYLKRKDNFDLKIK